MLQDHHFLMLKSVIAIVTAGGLYVADVLVDAPNWIGTLGLPTAMLILAIGGLIGLFKALLEERKARILDRDSFMKQLIDEAKDSANARSELIDATREQTREFKALCDELRRQRP
jgi:hypothetical protein